MTHAAASSPAPLSMLEILRPMTFATGATARPYKMRVHRQLAVACMLNILSLGLPIMMLQVYDRVIPHQSYGSLAVLAIGVLCALALDVALRIIRAYLITWSSASHEHSASCAAVNIFARSDLGAFERMSSGEHLQNMASLGRLREFYSGQAWSAVIDLPFAGIFLGLIYYLGGVLVLVPITLLAAFFVHAHFSGHTLRRALEARTQSDDRKASFVVSVLKGIHTVKSLSYESFLMRKFEAEQTEVSRNSYRVAQASGSAGIMSAAFGQLSLIATATAGFFLVLNGHLSVGGLSACTLLAGRAIQPVQRVLATWLRLQDLGIARRQANSLFTLPVMARLKSASPLVQGRVVLNNVTLQPVVEDASLEIMPGEIVAITGGSGADKSALLQMICGLSRPESGEIFLDNIQPHQYAMSDLSGLLGYLPQDGAIFKGSILDNLTGFRDDETSLRIAREAAQELGLDTVINLLPRGYQTQLSDTASDPVPPGVKQRIALARVLSHRPAILLFDDADRALDKEGYNLLFKLMGRLRGKTTILLVTQDQNLLSFADRFMKLENGRLESEAASGTQNIAILSQQR